MSSAGPDMDRGMLLCHVPKTGGISIRSAIETVYPENLRLRAYTVAEFDQVADEALATTRVVSCHLRSRQRQRLFRLSSVPWVEGLFLRDPIDHYVSRVTFARSRPDHQNQADFIQHSMLDLMDHPALESGPQFQSWYLRNAYALPEDLVGSELLERIRNRVSVIGVTTHLMAGYLRLCYWAGRVPVAQFPWLNLRSVPTVEEVIEEEAARRDPRLFEMTADDRKLHLRAGELSTEQFHAFLQILGIPELAPENDTVAAKYTLIAAAVAAAVADGPPPLTITNE